jgi:hypothetical protein
VICLSRCRRSGVGDDGGRGGGEKVPATEMQSVKHTNGGGGARGGGGGNGEAGGEGEGDNRVADSPWNEILVRK